jgi:1,4-alpha-glucan branching enzyme
MALIPVNFEYRTGLRRPFLVSARLSGSWNAQGLAAEQWSTVPMQPFIAEDGCPAFRATVQLDDAQLGRTFRWGVAVSTPEQPDVWGIPSEVNEAAVTERYRSFTFRAANQTERYWFAHCRRLGANKLATNGGPEAVRFACWAPNARGVEAVQGEREGGYIWNDGRGVVDVFPMRRGDDDVWTTDSTTSPALADFTRFRHQPYMFRVTKEGGSVAYRTDPYSRCQIGSGGKNPDAPRPGEAPWDGTRDDLDGSKSCSVVIDPEQVCELFQETDAQGRAVWPEQRWLTEDEFWRDEYNAAMPVPTRIEDVVIYELHVDGLGLDRGVDRGTLQDALDLIPYLRDLGVNCVQLMPMAEFQDRSGWGYSTSHYFSIEYAGGGRDKFKHFVRECHRNGIAVILDVVYNHYTFDAERAEWAYDSDAHENNIYYWYEGRASDYPLPDGGYVDNGSSGWAPRFWAEPVRKMFTSSAAVLLSEFHFDGFRVDLTQAIHRDNVRHADGRSVPAANQFGQKLLREWSNTLRLIRPNVFLIAEDHTGWQAVWQPTSQGGLGFDATWYADFYHHLIGDAQNDPSRARLLRIAGYGGTEAVRMRWFADTVATSSDHRIVYHESHDEAGNAEGSMRTIAVAVNAAPLVGETRRFAEARAHFAAGMTLLGPGTPMFFMGEEVGASQLYRYQGFAAAREDYHALRRDAGATLFRFYSDLIRLRVAHPALRTRSCEIVHANDDNRMIAFRRWSMNEDMLVVGCLNNWAFRGGYQFQDSRIADGRWREVFNSDAVEYGGSGLLNGGTIASQGGTLTVNVPANCVLVLQRE